MERQTMVPLVQAAAELRLSPTTLRRLIHAGRIHAEKPSRDFVILRDELERFKALSRPPGRPRKRLVAS
jgi:excisionase family DNA binding protein